MKTVIELLLYPCFVTITAILTNRLIKSTDTRLTILERSYREVYYPIYNILYKNGQALNTSPDDEYVETVKTAIFDILCQTSSTFPNELLEKTADLQTCNYHDYSEYIKQNCINSRDAMNYQSPNKIYRDLSSTRNFLMIFILILIAGAYIFVAYFGKTNNLTGSVLSIIVVFILTVFLKELPL